MQPDERKIDFALNLAAASIVFNFLVLAVCLFVFNHSGMPKEDTNALAVSITTIEIFLVIVALGGFWMLRQSVIATARTQTQEYLKEQQGALMSRMEEAARETADATARRVLEELQDDTPKPETDKQTAAFDGE